jgi:hypothetical protein
VWNRLFFEWSTLKDISLCVQLGHASREFCPTRELACKDFIVIHTNGIHIIMVDYCRCHSLPHHTKLLWIAWWPVTPLEPKTCATMEVLHHFKLLNFQGRLTGFSFYQVLQYKMDNSGLNKLPMCYLLLIESPHPPLMQNVGLPHLIYAHGSSILAYKDGKMRWKGLRSWGSL